MATFAAEKSVTLSAVLEDLSQGLTKWKKDDIGYGSIEKKYNLTIDEAMELFNHPKIKNVEHKVPKFTIIDDLPQTKAISKKSITVEEVEESLKEQEGKAFPAVEPIEKKQPNKKIQAFI